MSPTQTKTAVADHVRSPDRELTPAPAKLRSPSPPALAQSRGASLAPASPKSAAARLTSPAPEPSSRATPAPEPTLAPPVKDEPADASADADDADDEVDQDGVIDLDTFNQILDLDEDDTHDFSLGMTEAYFAQASTTFTDMDAAFEKKDLPKLSSLGHFLKGSSAALGVSAVQATCEHIQHYGALRDETKGTDLTPDEALAKIGPLLQRVKKEYGIAEKWLQKWYKEHAVPAEI